ncbi:MAG: hypothetical protein BZ137_01930 [Methanosphaera sp. rholeuAM130]|nr:MAG: hypothetical protein BZ137_01930 [Methanosphaera sp. rholeuAM130]
MIIYFSATGNCKYAATRISQKTGDKIVSIIQLNKNTDYCIELENDESLGIVIPTYFYGLPVLVKEYLSKMTIKTDNENPYLYSVSTYGTTPGGSIEIINNILNDKGHELSSKYTLQMVDTWTVEFDLTKEENIAYFTKNTEDKLNSIIESVMERRNDDLTEKTKGKLFYTFAQFAYELDRKTSYFSVDDSCTGCGLCQRDCPVEAIEIKGGKPVWIKDKCLICFRCIHRCPAFSIEYKHKTKVNGQYTNPNVAVFD